MEDPKNNQQKIEGFNQNLHDHDGKNSLPIPYSYLKNTPTSFTPVAHATSHEAGGSDVVTLSLIHYDAGNSGTTKTIDWDNGQYQLLTLTGNVTLTLNNPIVGKMYLRIVQGATPYTITWPTVKWENKTAPTLTTASGAIDLIVLLYDGTDYLASYSYNFG